MEARTHAGENCGDDLWIGVKGQSNSVIAGSPRNSFRASVACFTLGVEHCLGNGAYKLTDLRQTPNLSVLERSSQTMGDKLHGREGNNPDRRLRSPSSC